MLIVSKCLFFFFKIGHEIRGADYVQTNPWRVWDHLTKVVFLHLDRVLEPFQTYGL